MFRNLSGLVDAMVDSTSDSDEEMSESNVSVGEKILLVGYST